MKRFRVQVKMQRIASVLETFYVEANDERSAKQEALESAESAYPEYDSASVVGTPAQLFGDDE